MSVHPLSVSQTQFHNAHHFEVNNGQFMNIANATIISTKNDALSTNLWPHVAAGAIFDSAARYSAGKCHPGTRERMIEKILGWISSYETMEHRSALWLYGSAGAGKSALAHTICELLKQSHTDIYGGSFFFSSGSTDCGNALKLFTTLSYQLAIQFPFLRAEINDALSCDPSLPTKSMEVQLLSLICQPLLRCEALLTHKPIIVIDGLDECAQDKGIDIQRNIVACLAKCIGDHDVPLRVIIASRPEYWIREAFETMPLPKITLSLSLRDDIDADQDIKRYLTDEFEKIRLENKRVMWSVVTPWPAPKVIERFVEEASGQYIYASTILKFVGKSSKFSNPQEQLRIISTPGPHRALAFSELDRLYATILSAYPRWDSMKRVLAALLVKANRTIIQSVLDVKADELILVLDGLSSLIDIKKPGLLSDQNTFLLESIFDNMQDGRDQISFCHRSFSDFLQDQNRSAAFHIDLDSDSVPNDIVSGFFSMVHRNLDQNYRIEPAAFLGIDFATYRGILPTVIHISTRHCLTELLLQLIKEMSSKLLCFEPCRLIHMHSLFYFLHDMEPLKDNLQTHFGYDLCGLGPRDDHDQDRREILGKFHAACEWLGEIIDFACRKAVFAIHLCADFRATPTVVFLLEYCYRYGRKLPIEELSTVIGVGDVIPTLRQYRYVLHLRFVDDTSHTLSRIPVNAGKFLSSTRPRAQPYRHVSYQWSVYSTNLFENDDGPGWRGQGTWRDYRVLIAHQIVKSMLNRCRGFTLIHEQLVVKRFFKSRSISDIRTKEYFQSPFNLAMLAVMTDPAAWECLLDNRPDQWDTHLLIFSWINRQLTNPEAVALLKTYDKNLLPALQRVMAIFGHGIRQSLIASYKTEPCAFAPGDPSSGRMPRSTKIEVRPLPQGFHEQEMDGNYAMPLHYGLWSGNWRPFHDEVFGEKSPKIDGSINHTINPPDPSDWRPHLASKLLNVLVRFLYGRIHPDFLKEFVENDEESFAYLIQCLPYAHRNAENLDALRAVVYLYPKVRPVRPAWTPPDGLWSSIAHFIQRYDDDSILSFEELQFFMRWLNSEDHADIETYINQPVQGEGQSDDKQWWYHL